jgi:hypothetical protein
MGTFEGSSVHNRNREKKTKVGAGSRGSESGKEEK